MSGSVARLQQPPSGDGIPPADLYRIAVEEYRFQAQDNWSRTQYLLGFNVAVLAAALALVERSGRAAALVFLVGLCAAALSVLVVRQQHDYYRAARDHVRRVEDRYQVPGDERLTRPRRWARAVGLPASTKLCTCSSPSSERLISVALCSR